MSISIFYKPVPRQIRLEEVHQVPLLGAVSTLTRLPLPERTINFVPVHPREFQRRTRMSA